MKRIVFFVALLALLGCRENGHLAHVVRLDLVLADADAPVSVIDSLRQPIDGMFAVLGEPSPGVATLRLWATSPVVEVFQPAVDSVYPADYPFAELFGKIMQRAHEEHLDLGNITFASVVWGNPRPIVRVDSTLYVALNHYLGADYPGYAHWPDFRRQEKTPERLPYDVAGALVATSYTMDAGERPTLLQWMLYEGALVEARMRSVPDAQLHEALGMSAEQLAWADAHEGALWEELALRKHIYDSDPTIIDRYLTAAPSSPLAGGEAPGRIGRYIGYRIVRSYLKTHPDTPLATMFHPTPQTLITSGYAPRK